MDADRFLSLGLDIGTTTTHLVVSELTIGPVGDPGQVPRAGIAERVIRNRGRIRFTPLAGPDLIDVAAVEAIIREEFAAAGVRASDIRSGAVLVTGESARKDNARAVAERVSDLAGGFVAVAAGPNLEGVLSGRGAGAHEHSRRFRCCVLNIDIGGGTANFAWFDRGRFVEAACVRVGGRHIRFAPDGTVQSRTDAGARAADQAGIPLSVGANPAPAQRRAIAAALADVLLAACDGRWPDGPAAVTRPHVVPPRADVISFSGGVGEMMRQAVSARRPASEQEGGPLRYGDLGPELADAILALRGSPAFASVTTDWQYPDEPIRATVIGAGLHAASVSGDTVWADPALLPLADLPVLTPLRLASTLFDRQATADAVRAAAARADLDPAVQPAAWMLPELLPYSLEELERIAAVIAGAAADVGADRRPLVLLMTDDLGRTMGRLLAPLLPAGVLAVDELDRAEVEYVDIGRPAAGVLPVVFKSLAFG